MHYVCIVLVTKCSLNKLLKWGDSKSKTKILSHCSRKRELCSVYSKGKANCFEYNQITGSTPVLPTKKGNCVVITVYN